MPGGLWISSMAAKEMAGKGTVAKGKAAFVLLSFLPQSLYDQEASHQAFMGLHSNVE